jgi:hypothetical protein
MPTTVVFQRGKSSASVKSLHMLSALARMSTSTLQDPEKATERCVIFESFKFVYSSRRLTSLKR